jgi:hypothetical protein
MKFANHLKKSTVKLISSAERERERERERHIPSFKETLFLPRRLLAVVLWSIALLRRVPRLLRVTLDRVPWWRISILWIPYKYIYIQMINNRNPSLVQCVQSQRTHIYI